MFSISDVSVAWAFVWAWIVANLAMVISSVSVVIISIPVLYFSAKAIRHTCRAGGIVSRIIVYLRRQAPAPPATRAPRDAMEVLEEGLALPSPSVLQLTVRGLSRQLSSAEERMLRAVRSMYVTLDQTLCGASSSSAKASMEKLNDACSTVARTVATLACWRASTAVMSLVKPAKDLTDLFANCAKRNGYGEMSRGRQAHFVALLYQRAVAMEEVITQAIWAKTMPEIPTSYRDATSILELLERDERTNGARTSGAGRRTTGKGKGVAVESGAGRSTTGKVKGVAVTSGVEYIPYSPPATSANPRASQAAGSGIKLSRQ